MNKPSPNPFSGLKASLALILSGGWMGLVLHLLFRRRITAALTALESLFAQWQAGLLPSARSPLAVAPALAAGPSPAPTPANRQAQAAPRRRAPTPRRQRSTPAISSGAVMRAPKAGSWCIPRATVFMSAITSSTFSR